MGDDNFERGDNAARALTAAGYGDFDTTGQTMPTPDGGEAPVPEAYPISDFIADLMHLCQRHGFNAENIIERGICHYGSDVIEVAWANSEGWANCLQRRENEEPARTVLATAGVPESYWPRIFDYVGLNERHYAHTEGDDTTNQED